MTQRRDTLRLPQRELSPTDHLARELHLLERLRAHGVAVDPFAGDTDVPERLKRVRKAILDGRLAHVLCGVGNRPKSYSEVFREIYGEPL